MWETFSSTVRLITMKMGQKWDFKSHSGWHCDRKRILGSEYPLNFHYAYGIRNGFGIDFAPIIGNRWDTENATYAS
jgi:hypothetical protein